MFDFLKELNQVELVAEPAKEGKVKAEKVSKRVEKNPTNGADIRIMGNTGKVYPSVAFANEFGLEYTNKNANTISNGIDIFRAVDWTNYKNGPELLLAYSVRQDAPKVELFAGIRYDEAGEPINTVLEQGTALGEATLNLIATSLNFASFEAMLDELGTEEEGVRVPARYIDLYLVREIGNFLTMPDGIYNIPKMIERGEKKGQMTSVRRDKIKVLPLVLFTDEVRAQLEGNQDTTGNVQGEFQEAGTTTPATVLEGENGEEIPSTDLSNQSEEEASATQEDYTQVEASTENQA